jgi:hypothetical protein
LNSFLGIKNVEEEVGGQEREVMEKGSGDSGSTSRRTTTMPEHGKKVQNMLLKHICRWYTADNGSHKETGMQNHASTPSSW